METTTRLRLPLLSAGQSQKEIVHNEALLALDSLVGGSVEDGPRASPPPDPQFGQTFIVAQGAVGEWAGLDGKVLSFGPAGWREREPFEGQSLKVRTTGVEAVYRNGTWEFGIVRASSITVGGQQVVGGRSAAIPLPIGGANIDAEARTCIAALLDALRSHGLIAAS